MISKKVYCCAPEVPSIPVSSETAAVEVLGRIYRWLSCPLRPPLVPRGRTRPSVPALCQWWLQAPPAPARERAGRQRVNIELLVWCALFRLPVQSYTTCKTLLLQSYGTYSRTYVTHTSTHHSAGRDTPRTNTCETDSSSLSNFSPAGLMIFVAPETAIWEVR